MTGTTTAAVCEAVLAEIERAVVGKRAALTLIPPLPCSPAAMC